MKKMLFVSLALALVLASAPAFAGGVFGILNVKGAGVVTGGSSSTNAALLGVANASYGVQSGAVATTTPNGAFAMGGTEGGSKAGALGFANAQSNSFGGSGAIAVKGSLFGVVW
jgi:hypothetical protein